MQSIIKISQNVVFMFAINLLNLKANDARSQNPIQRSFLKLGFPYSSLGFGIMYTYVAGTFGIFDNSITTDK